MTVGTPDLLNKDPLKKAGSVFLGTLLMVLPSQQETIKIYPDLIQSIAIFLYFVCVLMLYFGYVTWVCTYISHINAHICRYAYADTHTNADTNNNTN